MKTTTTKETTTMTTTNTLTINSMVPTFHSILIRFQSRKPLSASVQTGFHRFKIHFLCFGVKVIASSGQDRLSVFQIKNLSIPRFQDGRLVLRRGRRKRRVGGQGWFQTKRKYKEMTRESLFGRNEPKREDWSVG